jgi:hypothetical protein
MEVLSFKLPVLGGNRVRLRSISPRPSSPMQDERYSRPKSMLAPVAGGSGALKRGHRARFEFFEALQNRRAMRHGYRVFLQALEREKVRQFTVK